MTTLVGIHHLGPLTFQVLYGRLPEQTLTPWYRFMSKRLSGTVNSETRFFFQPLVLSGQLSYRPVLSSSLHASDTVDLE